MAGFSPAALKLARPRGGFAQAGFGASGKSAGAIEQAGGAGADQGAMMNNRAKAPICSAACLSIPVPPRGPNRGQTPYGDGYWRGEGVGVGMRAGAAPVSSARAPLLSYSPRLYKRRPFNDALMNGAASASPELPPPC
jgi:hypothetical protein